MKHIGILGGGQLGRMLALAGRPLGLDFRIYEPANESSAAQVADRMQAEFEDYGRLYTFSQGLDVITFEFENVPVSTARWLADRTPLYPPPLALAEAQDRIAEKTFFQNLGVRVPNFAGIDSREDYDRAITGVGLPAVLKTTRFGYDGKGQMPIRTPDDVETAWERLGGRPLILEAFVPFDRELSLIAVRSATGEQAFYPLVENHHRAGMLHRTIAPAPNLTSELQHKAEAIAAKALQQLNYVGVLAIELFQVGAELIVNEMAPRVHNSGHWTIEGAVTSQFENHLRAILGWPLGDTSPRGYSQLINLIGSWPEPDELLGRRGVHLHLYGKAKRANRKVGHVTICGDDFASVQSQSDDLAEIIESRYTVRSF